MVYRLAVCISVFAWFRLYSVGPYTRLVNKKIRFCIPTLKSSDLIFIGVLKLVVHV